MRRDQSNQVKLDATGRNRLTPRPFVFAQGTNGVVQGSVYRGGWRFAYNWKWMSRESSQVEAPRQAENLKTRQMQ